MGVSHEETETRGAASVKGSVTQGKPARIASLTVLRGVVRHLPAVFAGAAFHPPVVLAVMNPEDGFDDGGIGRVPVFAPASVAEGGWVKWVEPSTRVDPWLIADAIDELVKRSIGDA